MTKILNKYQLFCGVEIFRCFSQNCEKRLLRSSRLPLCPSVRMEQFGSHLADVHEIWYLDIFRNYFQKIQESLI
jgi:hypothetical protein